MDMIFLSCLYEIVQYEGFYDCLHWIKKIQKQRKQLNFVHCNITNTDQILLCIVQLLIWYTGYTVYYLMIGYPLNVISWYETKPDDKNRKVWNLNVFLISHSGGNSLISFHGPTFYFLENICSKILCSLVIV